jgi:hypothetical protein
MAENSTGNQSGGVNIQGGTVNTGGGDIVGRDKILNQRTSRELGEALHPLAEAISAAPPEKRSEALAKLEELGKEAGKGEKRDDGVIAKLIEGLLGLVPSAVSTVVSAFSAPILGSIAGPATKSVLDKIKGE